MKQLEITTTMETDLLPHFYQVVSAAPAIEELRVLDWNLAADDVGTLVYAIDGDPKLFRDAAAETDGVEGVACASVDGPVSYALVDARPAAVPFFNEFMRATARAGLVVRKPLVYRDNRSYGYALGDPAALQAAIDGTPPGVDLQIERIGQFPTVFDEPTSRLSDRQRETVEAALELGYYDQPRGSTHEDIAAALGCAPSTVTTHLQKAEAKLVRDAMRSTHRR